MLTSGMLPALSAVSRYKNSKQNTKVKNHISVREREGSWEYFLPLISYYKTLLSFTIIQICEN